MLSIHITNFGQTAILSADGRIVNGATSELRNAVDSQLNSDLIVLDLTRVNTFDAHGLGVMLELRERTESKGVKFKLMNPTKRVRELLEITRLNSVFEFVSRPQFLSLLLRTRHTAPELASCA